MDSRSPAMPQRPRLAYTASLARQGTAALVLSLCAAQASAAYNAAYCQSVANTLNMADSKVKCNTLRINERGWSAGGY